MVQNELSLDTLAVTLPVAWRFWVSSGLVGPVSVFCGRVKWLDLQLLSQIGSLVLVGWSLKRPSNMRVYLRDGSAQTTVRAATLR